MFHYVEPDEENKAKRETIKRLVLSNETDRGLGQTKPSAENISELLKTCEDIETQCVILLKSLDQVLINDSHYGSEGREINKLYIFVKKGFSVLKRMSFQYLPKTDIQTLTDYRDSLQEFYDELDDRFKSIFETTFKQTPKHLRVSRKGYEKKASDRVKEATKLSLKKGLVEEFDNKYAELKAEYEPQIEFLEEDIEYRTAELEQISLRLRRIMQDIQELESNPRYVDEDIQDLAETYTFIEGQYLSQQEILNDKQEELDQLKRDLATLDKLNDSNQIKVEKYTARLNSLPNVPELDPDSDVYQELVSGEVLSKDYELVFKQFKIFIDTLSDGILRYNAGLSGKINKKVIENFRTPIDEAVGVGSGKKGGNRVRLFSGRYGDTHKRFL